MSTKDAICITTSTTLARLRGFPKIHLDDTQHKHVPGVKYDNNDLNMIDKDEI